MNPLDELNFCHHPPLLRLADYMGELDDLLNWAVDYGCLCDEGEERCGPCIAGEIQHALHPPKKLKRKREPPLGVRIEPGALRQLMVMRNG